MTVSAATTNSDSAFPPGALAGLRVLDFTQSLAGPYCTQMLADMGAEVLKIETIGTGDGTRGVGPFHPSDTSQKHSGYFHSVNRNKKSMALNLKSEAARQIVFELIKEYDVVVENFRVGTLEKLGLSYEELSARNERLIYATIRGFGDPRSGESPYVAWPAYDVVAQAMGGIAEVTGEPGHPTKVGPGVGDTVPGLFLAIGLLAAVVNRQNTGKGQFVDVGMVDAILSLSERIVYQRSFGNVIAHATGNHQPFMGPFGFFPAKDGFVAIASTSEHFFEAMCKAIDADDLLADERYGTIPDRQINLKAMIADLSARTARFTKAELLERLGGLVPFGPVYDMAEIAADPHFEARGMLAEIALDGIDERLTIAGSPIKMTRTPTTVRHAGPALGGDTYEVLAGLGRSHAEIMALHEQGAVALETGTGHENPEFAAQPKEALG